MDRRMLTAVIVSLLMITTVSVMSFSDEAYAYDTEGKISATKELTFTGNVRYNISPEAGGEPNIMVLIGTQIMDTTGSDKLCYVVNPSKAQIKSNGEFSVKSYRILEPGLDYYFLIESGYEIEITSSSLNGEPEPIFRYNYTEGTPLSGAESYTAFKLTETVGSSDTTFEITGANGPYDKIGAIHTTGILSVTVMDNNYKLSNVEIRLVRVGETDEDKYSFSGLTVSDGTCTIKEISTGVYNLIAINENYRQEGNVQVVITKGNITTTTVEMEVLMMEGEYWGYDLPHFLMLCAGMLCIVIIVTSIILQHRRARGKGGDWILNDVEDEDEED